MKITSTGGDSNDNINNGILGLQIRQGDKLGSEGTTPITCETLAKRVENEVRQWNTNRDILKLSDTSTIRTKRISYVFLMTME